MCLNKTGLAKQVNFHWDRIVGSSLLNTQQEQIWSGHDERLVPLPSLLRVVESLVWF